MTSQADLLTQGWAVHQGGDRATAEQMYRQVIAAEPNNANAWCYLGIVLHDQDRFEQAVAAYRKAIQLQPQFPIAFNNLGNTLRQLKRLDEAVACFDHALKLKPDYVNAHKNKGTALVWEGCLDEAVACYKKALELDPDDAECHKNLGVIWLLQGDFDRGWREYEWRWKTDDASLPQLSEPLWDGSALDGRTILLTPEQGFGDTIHFIRYAEVLKRQFDCRVIVQCQRALLPLLSTCAGIDKLVAQGDPIEPFDVFSPLINIPGILGHTTSTFPAEVPYLHADPNLVEQWRGELDQMRGVRVGIVWQGNQQYHADCMRSMPLAEFGPLGKLDGIQLISLQRGFGVEQLDALAGRLDVIHLGDRVDESTGAFMDTAAVLKSLDLVITADSVMGHLAGAIGVPVWIALAQVPHWPWLLDRHDSPWYPSARLFRQPRMGDWGTVFRRMADQLGEDFASVQPKRAEAYQVMTSGRNRLTRARHGLMLFNRHDKYIGRSIDRYGEFSEAESDLFQQILSPGAVVVEAGANVGAHTLPLAQSVGPRGKVYAFEPQRLLFQCLCGNIALNSIANVDCRYEALGAKPGAATIPPLDYDAENNFGGLGLTETATGEQVPIVTIDSLELTRCDLIKADVEGMELDVLRGAAVTIDRFHPILYVENDRRELSPALIKHIQGLDYKLYWHVPPLFNPANYFGNGENEFGNLVSVNMLGIHASVKSSISGLRPVEGPQSDWMSH